MCLCQLQYLPIISLYSPGFLIWLKQTYLPVIQVWLSIIPSPLLHMCSQSPRSRGFCLSLSLWDPWLSHSFPAPQKASSLSWVMPERSICSPDFQAAHLVLHITSNPDLFMQSCFKLFGGSPQGALQRATKLFSLPQPTSTYCSAFRCRCIYHALVYVSTVSSECSFIPWSPLPKNHTHLTRPRPYHLK